MSMKADSNGIERTSSSSHSDGVHNGNNEVAKGPYTTTEVRDVTMHDQHEGSPARNFSLLSLVGLAYAILNSWTAMAASLSVALPSGGPSVVIWGILISFIGNLAMAASLAEIFHVYPTSGGQYHFVSVLSPPRYATVFAFIQGWICCAAWVSLTATASSLAGQLITGMIGLAHSSYEAQRYQIFLIYTAYALAALALNIYGLRLLPLVNKMAIFWSLAGASTIAIVCLACKSGDYQPSKFVFTEYINETGWNPGVAWILGLLQSSFGLTGFDGITHVCDEMPRPHINGPKAMIAAVLIGSSSSFIFLICLLFCITDVDGVITSSAGALLESIYQATGSVTGSLCLQVFPVVSMAFAAQGILTGSSRVLLAFARDGGLPFSHIFARVNKDGVPVPALILNSSLVIIFGLVYLGSSSALNAILSSSVVFLNVSYSAPVLILLVRGRHLLRPASFPEPTLTLGPIFGPIVNLVGLLFTLFTTVFFLFPPVNPTSGSSMNYAVAVFGVVLVIATLHYFISARKTYTGPKDMGALLELARAEIDTNETVEKKREAGDREL